MVQGDAVHPLAEDGSGRAKPLFVNKHGKRLSSRPSRKLDKYLLAAGLDIDISPTRFVTVFATHLLDNARTCAACRNRWAPVDLDHTGVPHSSRTARVQEAYNKSHPRGIGLQVSHLGPGRTPGYWPLFSSYELHSPPTAIVVCCAYSSVCSSSTRSTCRQDRSRIMTRPCSWVRQERRHASVPSEQRSDAEFAPHHACSWSRIPYLARSLRGCLVRPGHETSAPRRPQAAMSLIESRGRRGGAGHQSRQRPSEPIARRLDDEGRIVLHLRIRQSQDRFSPTAVRVPPPAEQAGRAGAAQPRPSPRSSASCPEMQRTRPRLKFAGRHDALEPVFATTVCSRETRGLPLLVAPVPH